MQLQNKRSIEMKTAFKIDKDGKKDKLKMTQQQIGRQKIKTKSTATKQKQAKQTSKGKNGKKR